MAPPSYSHLQYINNLEICLKNICLDMDFDVWINMVDWVILEIVLIRKTLNLTNEQMMALINQGFSQTLFGFDEIKPMIKSLIQNERFNIYAQPQKSVDVGDPFREFAEIMLVAKNDDDSSPLEILETPYSMVSKSKENISNNYPSNRLNSENVSKDTSKRLLGSSEKGVGTLHLGVDLDDGPAKKASKTKHQCSHKETPQANQGDEEEIQATEVKDFPINGSKTRKGTSQYCGVSRTILPQKKKWVAQTKLPNSRKCISKYFGSELEAAIYYDEMVRGLNMKTRNLNFPTEEEVASGWGKCLSQIDDDLNPFRSNLHSLGRSKFSKYHGVYWDKHRNQWVVRAWDNGQRRYLGRFQDEVEAAKAYDEYALNKGLHQKNLNFSVHCDT